jgi:hypothetical protein
LGPRPRERRHLGSLEQTAPTAEEAHDLPVAGPGGVLAMPLVASGASITPVGGRWLTTGLERPAS